MKKNNFLLFLSVALVIGLSFPAYSQNIVDLLSNNDSLEEIINTTSPALLKNQNTFSESPVDSSRAQNEKSKGAILENITPEAKDLSSKIEHDYYSRLTNIIDKKLSTTSFANEVIPQFGYNNFYSKNNYSKTFGSLYGSAQDQYVMGVGDEIIINFRGEKNNYEKAKVDSEGRIIISDFMPIMAQGRTFGEVKAEIEAVASENLVKTELFISLGGIKDISVVIAGEVTNPGVYSLSGFSNLFDLIFAAGGINKTGSLRKIEIISNGSKRVADLYSVLAGTGDIKDTTLADGDKIIVPVINDTIAIIGDVTRSGIYEIDEGGITAQKALELAGGTLRPSGYRYITLSSDDTGLDVVKEINNLSYTLLKSDILIVSRLRENKTGQITLEGHVSVSGVRSILTNPDLSSIITGPELFKDDPYLLFAVVQRRDKATLARHFIPVDLSAVIEGKEHFVMEDGDKILVFSRQDISWLSSADVQSILNRKVPPSVLKLIEKSSSNIENASSFSIDRNQLDMMGFDSSTIDKSTEKDSPKIEYVKAWADPSICPGLKSLVKAVASGWTDRFAAATQIRGKEGAGLIEDLRPCPDLFADYPELLPFVLNNVTTINGEIREPGIYPIAGATLLSSLISVGGGLSHNIDIGSIEITNYSDYKKAKSSVNIIDGTKTPLTEISVSAGDSVRFNQIFSDRETGEIMLTGEFKRPGSYTIRKGEKLSDLIARAGGLTNDAYTTGAVFTRESVRQAEYKMIQVALKNMESGFMHSMASMELKNVSPTAVVAMVAQLKSLLSDSEPLGRVIVEADPLKLQMNPELDIILQPNDHIYMPKRPQHVMVSGEVLNSGAMQFISGTSPREYIKMAGGLSQSSDEDRTYVIMPNGTARPINISSWNFMPINIPPGSTIFVPRDTAPFNLMIITKDILDIVSKAAVTAASIKVLNDD